ncbi:hypothetical protein UA08_03186 [Talaromyces atroroseus]|uniref:Calcipressin n=1 Tax=Talaromyces atroroseus TaxID=1441469 RepID=A0A225AHL4_TALAT|nr:hypothetical protein UA08_03186 [Talaromyces atroroseus]OKL60921.1 hypothetical protein UA08_03186 [Talaromyces atroroseus]
MGTADQTIISLSLSLALAHEVEVAQEHVRRTLAVDWLRMLIAYRCPHRRMTVATFPPTSSRASSSPSTHNKLSSSSQSLLVSKRLQMLSGNAMASSAGNAPHAKQLSRSSSTSTTTSTSSSRSRPCLTLDLSNLPSLSRPSPPSNTLIITELHNLIVFQPACLTAIREQITSIAPLNSFSPLPSFRRIVCSFLSIDDAVKVRQNLECTKTIFDECGLRARIYFGERTPIENTEEAKRKKLLEAPHSSKLFFISPPPSPPHGWVMRNEDPPNKEVHASDLADALARLGTAAAGQSAPDTSSNDPMSPISVASYGSDNNNNSNNIGNINPINPNNKEVTPGLGRAGSWPSSTGAGRSRSSTLIYHPNDHGGSPNLPAVMVEDTSIDDEDDEDFMNLSSDGEPKKIFAHTSRPPVELME